MTEQQPLCARATSVAGLALAGLVVALLTQPVFANPAVWSFEWPRTNFDKTTVDFDEIKSGGPPKDGIPPIDDPKFVDWTAASDLAPTEPVIGLILGQEMKAYPLRILMWHEIANDEIGGTPVAATFCPLCNAVIVFDRRITIDGAERVLDFGTTGKLRKSDLVMWDRQTESWWQQFTGEAIVGDLLGQRLKILPSRLESWENFQARAAAHPGATPQVLIPNNPSMRRYGANPYSGYDSLQQPFLYNGETPEGIGALERVISLEGKTEAWSLALLRQKGEIVTKDGVVLRWTPGQNSALDTRTISDGKDVGNVTAQKDGEDAPYFVDFAFAFHAFRPDAPIHLPE
ncbi:MAG: DUF3179 domain-containing protein [Alphaproteobacteria bacterium]|nr:DUF3179 domain-containing protein [Alphaproteobacteria bacterium]